MQIVIVYLLRTKQFLNQQIYVGNLKSLQHRIEVDRRIKSAITRVDHPYPLKRVIIFYGGKKDDHRRRIVGFSALDFG